MGQKLGCELGAWRGLGLELDDGFYLLAPLVAWCAHRRDIGHGRMLEQDRIDLGGVDVDAARDDDLGTASREEQESVLVEIAKIPHRKRVAPVGRRRLLRSMKVLKAPAGWRTEVDGSDLARRQCGSRFVEDLDGLVIQPAAHAAGF